MAIWCGQPDLMGLCEGATVYVAARGPRSAVVVLDGDLDEAATRELMNTIWREAQRPQCRIVYIVLITLRGEIDNLTLYCNTTLGLLPERVATVAYLATCCGAGLYLAGRCHLHFASPTAIIGHAECWSADGTPREGLTDQMVALLEHELPDVHPRTWPRLVNHAINGEQAEALQIATCKRSVWDLCSLREGEGVATC